VKICNGEKMNNITIETWIDSDGDRWYVIDDKSGFLELQQREEGETIGSMLLPSDIALQLLASIGANRR